MGTNFFWKFNPDTMGQWESSIEEVNVKKHIGKRSYAGAYCHDCGISLDWRFSSCPGCGKSSDDVEGACKFTWAMMKHERQLKEFSVKYPDMKICYDEYGAEYTSSEMLKELDNCKIINQLAVEFC